MQPPDEEQLVATPSQQYPVDFRHTMPAGITASGGHEREVPEQDSATSQGPAAGRQTAPEMKTAGQLAVYPVQMSGASQTSEILASQTYPAGRNVSTQSGVVPLQ